MIHIIIRDKLRWCLQPPSQSDPTLTTKPSGLTTASRSLKVTDEYNSDHGNLVWFTSTRGGISREPARACQCAEEGNQPWGWFALFLLWCAICLYSVLFAKWQIYCTYWYGTLNLLHNIPIPTPTRPSMTNISFHKYLTKYLPNTFSYKCSTQVDSYSAFYDNTGEDGAGSTGLTQQIKGTTEVDSL